MKATMKKRRGQNTAEYLIMLVLIAGGSIGVFSVFGTTIRKHLGNVVLAFGGTSSGWQSDIATTATKAGTIAGKAVTMQGSVGDDAVPSYGNSGNSPTP